MTTGHALAREAVRLVGTPFRHQGRTTAGIDCAGVLWLAAKRAGFVLPDVRDYGTSASAEDVVQNLDRVAVAIAWRDMGVGDVLLFEFRGAAPHLGIVVDRVGVPEQLRVVHASGGGRRGRVVMQPLGDNLRAAITGVWRLRAVHAQREF